MKKLTFLPASRYSTLTTRIGGTCRSMSPTQKTSRQATKMIRHTTEQEMARFCMPVLKRL